LLGPQDSYFKKGIHKQTLPYPIIRVNQKYFLKHMLKFLEINIKKILVVQKINISIFKNTNTHKIESFMWHLYSFSYNTRMSENNKENK